MTITVTTGGPIGGADPVESYSGLITTIERYLARSDLTSYIPDWFSMAEHWLNYGSENSPPLRCREMELAVALTPVAGVCDLPVDYLAYRTVTEGVSGRAPMSFITYDAATARYPDGAAGLGEAFSIVGESLYTFPAVTNTVNLVFYQKIPGLSASNTTNWLLEKNWSIYLHVTLMAAFDYIRDDSSLEKHARMASQLIAGMNKGDLNAKYARAGLVLRGPTP